MKLSDLFKRKKDIELTFYNKESETQKIALTKQQVNDYTRNIPIADVKVYLKKEYDRAFEREELIRTQQKRLEEYEKLSQKYDAMLIVQEKREERYKIQEKDLISFKNELKKEKENYKDLSSKMLDTLKNCEKMEKQLKNSKIIAIKEYKQYLINEISMLKGILSKDKIIKLVKNSDIK